VDRRRYPFKLSLGGGKNAYVDILHYSDRHSFIGSTSIGLIAAFEEVSLLRVTNG